MFQRANVGRVVFRGSYPWPPFPPLQRPRRGRSGAGRDPRGSTVRLLPRRGGVHRSAAGGRGAGSACTGSPSSPRPTTSCTSSAPATSSEWRSRYAGSSRRCSTSRLPSRWSEARACRRARRGAATRWCRFRSRPRSGPRARTTTCPTDRRPSPGGRDDPGHRPGSSRPGLSGAYRKGGGGGIRTLDPPNDG